MKNLDKKKIIFIAFAIVLLGLSAYFIFTLINKPKAKYPEQPITQKALFKSDEQIQLNSTETPTGDYQIYALSDNVKLGNVQKLVDKIAPNAKITAQEDGIYYKWEDKKTSFFYELDQNTLIFNLEQCIDWTEKEITEYSIATFVKRYFNTNWQYKYISKEQRTGGEVAYFFSRYLEDGNILETKDLNGQTDMLLVNGSKITGGKLLLTDFTTTNIKVPLISNDSLSKYINLKDFPKEIYPQYSTIQSTILKEISYMSNDFVEVTKTLDNCKGSSIKVVYLYKSFDQSIVTPVFHIDLQCEVEYKSKKYAVPAVGYVNAVDPNYLSIPE